MKVKKKIRYAGECCICHEPIMVNEKYVEATYENKRCHLGCMKNTTTKITNIKAYMVTTLYNAPSTINHYYQQEVQHDMYGGGWHEKGIV